MIASLKNIIWKLLILVLFWNSFQTAFCQAPVFRHFTDKDGLPSTEVYQVIQDAKGYLWFATDGGVARYDGYDFTTFTKEDGLPENMVYDMHLDHKGRVWFATLSGNILHFNPQEEQFHLQPIQLDQGRISKEHGQVDDLFVGINDTVWVGFFNSKMGKRILKISPHGDVSWVKMEEGVYNLEEIYIQELEGGKLMVSTVSNKKTEETVPVRCVANLKNKKIQFDFKENGYSYSRPEVARINNDKLVVASGTSLFEIDNNGLGRHVTLPGAHTSSMFIDREKNLWLGLYSTLGVMCFPNGS